MSTLTFGYRGVDRSGTRTSGSVVAVSRAEALRKVAAMGVTPTDLRLGTHAVRARSLLARRADKVSVKDIAHFTYQLGVLVSARIPLSDGLHSIAEQERPGRLRDLIDDLSRRVQSGEKIADALAAYHGVFSPVYISTVRAAEAAGSLPVILAHMSDMLERQEEMRSQVRGALMYPACVVGALALAVLFLMAFVVPRFAEMFARRGVDLPLFTEALMLFGKSIQIYWWAYALLVAAAFFSFRRLKRSPAGREFLDRKFHKLPYLRSILIGLAVARFARVLGISLSSGLSLIDALRLAGQASGRELLLADARRMTQQVSTGGRLSEVLDACSYLTPFARRMLSAGEYSGEIPKMCDIIARHYDRESTHLAKNIATVIEPVLIIAIAVIVLVVALAIFLPMWDMVKLVG